ncbi:hypothetical protein LIER_04103 [Lithospermum erythrorhizon]|uniref:Uncharacterized protein n=1 Tax=Lithospermum erythrorhizon TaxID=34254 RepID=A0AAV3NXF7_LITER
MGRRTIPYTAPVRRESELVAGQQSRHDAASHEAVAPAPPTDAMVPLQWQMDSLSARVAIHVRPGTNTELAGLAPFMLEIRSAIEEKRLLPRPPQQKTPQNKMDMSKFCQYRKDHGHGTDDYQHLNIDIEKIFQRGKLNDYVHKESQSVNKSFDRDKSRSLEGPPNITGRENVISGGRRGGGYSGAPGGRMPRGIFTR